MSLFSLNGLIRVAVSGIAAATSAQRKAVSIPVNGVYSASKPGMVDPLVDPVPTARQARQVIDLTIPNGQSVPAAAVDLGAGVLVGIQLPAAWTAADITFLAGYDAATLVDLIDAGGDTERKYEAAASRFIPCDPADWAGVQFLKIRSGTVASAVAQGAARTIKLIVQR